MQAVSIATVIKYNCHTERTVHTVSKAYDTIVIHTDGTMETVFTACSTERVVT